MYILTLRSFVDLVSANSMDTAVLFYPRGGSAQVIRYLLRKLNGRGWDTRLMAGTLGPPNAPSNAFAFYRDLNLHAFDYDTAQAAFEVGQDAMSTERPFHPSYEDRGHCPDIMFSAVPPTTATHLAQAWHDHLETHRSPLPKLLHLHHLSHLQHAAHVAYPHIPRVTTLHGTELKLIDGMVRRSRLARRVGLPIEHLMHYFSSGHPDLVSRAEVLAARYGLTEDERDMLLDTRWRNWQYSSYWLRYLRDAVRHAGNIVAVSEHDSTLACQLLGLKENEVSIIANGVDTEQFRPIHFCNEERVRYFRKWLVEDPRGWRPGMLPGSIRYSEADLRRMYDAHGNIRPVILWVGRFLDFKRVPILLEAFAWVRSRVDNAPVLLMWGGYPGEYEGVHPVELADSLGISHDVFFLGWRDHDELPLGLNCADVMAAPAVNEPFGMVYIESMACGTPPISTATGGPSKTIRSTGIKATGWTVRPDDVVELGAALIEAISNQAERTRRGRNGVTLVRRGYDWEIVADRYTAVYEEICTK